MSILALALLEASPGGVGLCLSVPVEPGEELGLDVEADGLPAPFRGTGVVRWAVHQDDGPCTAGVALPGPEGTIGVWATSNEGDAEEQATNG